MSIQVAALYYWTAVDKMTVGFLSGERLKQMTMDYYTGSSELGGGLVGALLLHGSIHVLLGVQTFSPTMWLLYLAFFPADEVHRFIERLSGHPVPQPDPAPERSLPEVAPDGVQVGQ